MLTELPWLFISVVGTVSGFALGYLVAMAADYAYKEEEL